MMLGRRMIHINRYYPPEKNKCFNVISSKQN
jgi:hypothetical protein